jgi:FkbM family methyltransferase
MELIKSIGRQVVRQIIRLPIRGKTRLRSWTDSRLKPKGVVEFVRIGPCIVPLSHEFEATRNMAYGMYETCELAGIRKLVKAGDTVVDIGANVGFFTAHLSAMVGRTGNVISIEPGRTPLQFLTQTVDSCVYENIQLCRCAVSSRCGQTTFYETEVILDKGYGRIDERPSSRFEKVTEYQVEVLSPLAVFQRYNLKDISFIKLDVEGQEKDVILELEPIFKTCGTPSLMTEVTISERWAPDLHEYGKFLRSFGYTPHKANRQMRAIELRELKDGFHGNIFWLPSRIAQKTCRALPE